MEVRPRARANLHGERESGDHAHTRERLAGGRDDAAPARGALCSLETEADSAFPCVERDRTAAVEAPRVEREQRVAALEQARELEAPVLVSRRDERRLFPVELTGEDLLD